MISLYLRNLLFTILQPGLVAGLIPYLILKRTDHWVFQSGWLQYLGLLVFLVGSIIMFHCIFTFAHKGKGTLSPADRTQKLVTSGLYTYSRSPMYVGVLLILIGESVYFQSGHLLIYSILVFFVFNLFIQYVEEPRLRRDFGEEYHKYCDRVRRWF